VRASAPDRPVSGAESPVAGAKIALGWVQPGQSNWAELAWNGLGSPAAPVLALVVSPQLPSGSGVFEFEAALVVELLTESQGVRRRPSPSEIRVGLLNRPDRQHARWYRPVTSAEISAAAGLATAKGSTGRQ